MITDGMSAAGAMSPSAAVTSGPAGRMTPVIRLVTESGGTHHPTPLPASSTFVYLPLRPVADAPGCSRLRVDG